MLVCFLPTADYFLIGNPPFDDNSLMIHGYLGKPPELTIAKDGHQLFKIHTPGVGGASHKRGVSLESVIKPGYYISWADDYKIRLKKLTDEKSSKKPVSYRTL